MTSLPCQYTLAVQLLYLLAMVIDPLQEGDLHKVEGVYDHGQQVEELHGQGVLAGQGGHLDNVHEEVKLISKL